MSSLACRQSTSAPVGTTIAPFDGLVGGSGVVGAATGTACPGAASQEKSGPLLGRLASPTGPLIQVVLPLVNAVQLSALRQTSRPPAVRCKLLPSSGLNHSFSRQSPTMLGI